MKEAIDLIFPKNLIQEPIIYNMSREVPVIFNIRRAKVTEKVGEIVLELEGSNEVLSQAKEWLTAHGIKVEPITHDTLEG